MYTLPWMLNKGFLFCLVFSAFYNSRYWSRIFIGFFGTFLAVWLIGGSQAFSVTQWGHIIPHLHLGSFLLLILFGALKGNYSFWRKTLALHNLKRSVFASHHLCNLQWSFWLTNFLYKTGLILTIPIEVPVLNLLLLGVVLYFVCRFLLFVCYCPELCVCDRYSSKGCCVQVLVLLASVSNMIL